MIALVLALTLGADPLATAVVKGLTVKLPTSGWFRTDTEDGVAIEEKAGGATLELSVYPVDPKRTPRQCMAQLKEAIGEGYTDVTVGGFPAARRVQIDRLGGPDAGSDAPRVSTVSYVGCNGSLKWVLSLGSNQAQAARFGVVLMRVVDSLKYQ